MGLEESLRSTAKAFVELRRVLSKTHFRLRLKTGRKWVMMAPNGQNSKERRRNQVRLKGRRCKEK